MPTCVVRERRSVRWVACCVCCVRRDTRDGPGGHRTDRRGDRSGRSDQRTRGFRDACKANRDHARRTDDDQVAVWRRRPRRKRHPWHLPQAWSRCRCGGRKPSAANRPVVGPAAGRFVGPAVSQEAVSYCHCREFWKSHRSHYTSARRVLDRRGVSVRIHVSEPGREDVPRQRSGRRNGHDSDSRISARRRYETGFPRIPRRANRRIEVCHASCGVPGRLALGRLAVAQKIRHRQQCGRIWRGIRLRNSDHRQSGHVRRASLPSAVGRQRIPQPAGIHHGGPGQRWSRGKEVEPSDAVPRDGIPCPFVPRWPAK